MSNDPFGICHVCQEPVMPGQPRYTAGEEADPPRYCHWDCHEIELNRWKKAFEKLPQTVDRARAALDKLRRLGDDR
jgi:hypothetical protein